METNKIKSNKRAMLESTLGKVVLAVIILVIIIGLIMVFTGRLQSIWKAVARALRFG